MKPKKAKSRKTWTSGGAYAGRAVHHSKYDMTIIIYKPNHNQPIGNFLIK